MVSGRRDRVDRRPDRDRAGAARGDVAQVAGDDAAALGARRRAGRRGDEAEAGGDRVREADVAGGRGPVVSDRQRVGDRVARRRARDVRDLHDRDVGGVGHRDARARLVVARVRVGDVGVDARRIGDRRGRTGVDRDPDRGGRCSPAGMSPRLQVTVPAACVQSGRGDECDTRGQHVGDHGVERRARAIVGRGQLVDDLVAGVGARRRRGLQRPRGRRAARRRRRPCWCRSSGSGRSRRRRSKRCWRSRRAARDRARSPRPSRSRRPRGRRRRRSARRRRSRSRRPRRWRRSGRQVARQPIADRDAGGVRGPVVGGDQRVGDQPARGGRVRGERLFDAEVDRPHRDVGVVGVVARGRVGGARARRSRRWRSCGPRPRRSPAP